MFCINCGKNLENGAVVCVNCGHPTPKLSEHNDKKNIYYSSAQQQYNGFNIPVIDSPDAEYVPALKKFEDEVSSIYLFSILSLIFGFIFLIITSVKVKNLPVYGFSLENPYLIAQFQSTQRKLQSAKTIMYVATALCCIFIVFIVMGIISEMV